MRKNATKLILKRVYPSLWQALALVLLTIDFAVSEEPISPFNVEENTIPTPLTTIPGDITNGRTVFLDRQRGHCLLCHTISTIDEPFHGTLGPDLTDIGLRMTDGQIRLQIVDPSRFNPSTIMPAYYRTKDLHQVAEQYRDKPILTAQEIEDLIAFLAVQGKKKDLK